MALQLSVAVRNHQLDKFDDPVSGSLVIRSGAAPATADTAATGTVLATIALPAGYLAAASGGTVSKSGTWSDASADATGTAGYFRLLSNGGNTVCQGTVGTSGTDMIVDSVSFTAGQSFSVITFTITAPNA